MKRAHATWRAENVLVLETPYNPTFIQSFKDAVSYEDREWDAENKWWVVYGASVFNAFDLFNQFFPSGTVTDNRNKKRDWDSFSSEPPTSNEDCVTLHVRDDAPFEVIQAAYRALSKLFHPDAGGNTETMQSINAAYERLSFKRKGKAA